MPRRQAKRTPIRTTDGRTHPVETRTLPLGAAPTAADLSQPGGVDCYADYWKSWWSRKRAGLPTE